MTRELSLADAVGNVLRRSPVPVRRIRGKSAAARAASIEKRMVASMAADESDSDAARAATPSDKRGMKRKRKPSLAIKRKRLQYIRTEMLHKGQQLASLKEDYEHLTGGGKSTLCESGTAWRI